MSRSAVLTLAVFLIGGVAGATTYYVRPNGGTGSQCSGKADAPYAGAGRNQPCAWKHPFIALNSHGRWKLRPGDTLFVHSGSYKMGFGAPNTGWCDAESAWDCHLPPLPSGADAEHPTRILGEGWNSGCKNPPELWGSQRADVLLDLDGTSDAQVNCLELTDHSGCVEFHATDSVRCERDSYPFGDWASTGIYARDSDSVSLTAVNIHGFASQGVQAGRLSNWRVTNVRIAGNGWSGWDGDLPGEDDSNHGVMRFRRWKVEWNGCAETYPGGKPDHCWAQQAGGYGDGVGTGPTGGHWIIEDSVFRHNTSDGLDLLYVGRAGSGRVEIRRSIAEGNAGNQMKVNGSTTIVNSLIVGNCGFFYGKPFAAEMGGRMSGDHCRAGGGALDISLTPGATSYVINCTIASQGDTLAGIECDTEEACTGTEKVYVQNNIFRGYADFLQAGDRSAFLWDPSGYARGRTAYNLEYGAKHQICRAPNICANPRFVNDDLDELDAHLRHGSRAIDTGLPEGSLGGLIPDHDLSRHPRPQGRGVDRGAFEFPGNTGEMASQAYRLLLNRGTAMLSVTTAKSER